ncbi:hypothetical protein MPTK1_6g04180 [Marchantia polymorpha subsp. ruderalis]|uniref:Uncharacterized protein n=2 Tax=Marchantia polymorpha TaxID=3197 RepID=A0AAF6BND7_MARPO|nr:hypothetical protein MARPO_0034s0100 [Marchantia polymorpha]BBN13521.1 hypothetical protein Mp_6g04180 [Marchantia polymorpha subsp. ruderalis]|eukprot:PTQ41518.1 hypothetical protein MARPO_0034s0100 [Marchantia polymorpha]
MVTRSSYVTLKSLQCHMDEFGLDCCVSDARRRYLSSHHRRLDRSAETETETEGRSGAGLWRTNPSHLLTHSLTHSCGVLPPPQRNSRITPMQLLEMSKLCLPCPIWVKSVEEVFGKKQARSCSTHVHGREVQITACAKV